MASPLIFRRSGIYNKKMMRLGAAMRRYSEIHLPPEQNLNSLALEVEALEELSLSAFSLMKAIKHNIAESKKIGLISVSKTCVCKILDCDNLTCDCSCHEKEKAQKSRVIYLSGETVTPFSKI